MLRLTNKSGTKFAGRHRDYERPAYLNSIKDIVRQTKRDRAHIPNISK